MSTIRLMIAEDETVVRHALGQLLGSEDDINVVALAPNGEAAIEMARDAKPDVILMDINLPELNGLQATRELKEHCPDIKVIMLTAYDDDEQVYHAIRAGASAYHAKDVKPERLIGVIRQVNEGYYVVDDRLLDEDGIGDWLLKKYQRFGAEFFVGDEEFLSPLTPREMEILGLVVQGMSNRSIAYDLGISHQTVKNHMTAILRKLGATGRTEAAVSALRRGWIPLRRRQSSPDGTASGRE